MWVAATRVHSSDPALFEEVFAIGSQKITCIDNCYELITHLKKKHDAAYGASVEFICADARKLQDVFKEPCFDTIFDKGTFDFILAGDVSINHATKYLEEINRILTNNGTFIVLSTLDVATTAKYFNKMNWRVKHIEVEKLDFEQKVYKKNQTPPKNCYYLYICIKNFKNLGESHMMEEENVQEVIEEAVVQPEVKPKPAKAKAESKPKSKSKAKSKDKKK